MDAWMDGKLSISTRSTYLATLAQEKGGVELLAASLVRRQFDAVCDRLARNDARRVRQALEQRLALVLAARCHV